MSIDRCGQILGICRYVAVKKIPAMAMKSYIAATNHVCVGTQESSDSAAQSELLFSFFMFEFDSVYVVWIYWMLWTNPWCNHTFHLQRQKLGL